MQIKKGHGIKPTLHLNTRIKLDIFHTSILRKCMRIYPSYIWIYSRQTFNQGKIH